MAEKPKEDAQEEAIKRELLRFAMKLNPSLKQAEGGTARVIEKVEAARGTAPGAEGQKPPPTSLVEALDQQKEKFYAEQKRLGEELARLEKALRDLGPATQERVVGLLVQHDPNMSSALTNE